MCKNIDVYFYLFLIKKTIYAIWLVPCGDHGDDSMGMAYLTPTPLFNRQRMCKSRFHSYHKHYKEQTLL